MLYETVFNILKYLLTVFFRALLRHVLTVDVTKQDKTFRTDMENVDKNVSELVSDSSQHIQPTSSAIKLQTKIGRYSII